MGEIYSNCEQVFIYLGQYHAPRELAQSCTSREQNSFTAIYGGELEKNEDLLHQYAIDLNGFLNPMKVDYLLHCGFFFIHTLVGMTPVGVSDFPPFCWGDEVTPDQREYIRRFDSAMRFLAKNTWFRRLWTLQEAVLAPAGRLIFGNYSIDWEMFVRGALELMSRGHGSSLSMDLWDVLILQPLS